MLVAFRVGGVLRDISLAGLPAGLLFAGRTGSGLLRLFRGLWLRTHVFSEFVLSISIYWSGQRYLQCYRMRRRAEREKAFAYITPEIMSRKEKGTTGEGAQVPRK